MKNMELTIISLHFFFLFVFCNGIESPQYTVLHSESDFEVRLYRESAWMSAPVREISFEKATKLGFHRLYQYIHGANINSSTLVMTAPILTSISPEAYRQQHYVRFYLSTKFNGKPPSPLPELNLQLSKWKTHCVAVRKFSGFASDDIISKEVGALVTNIDSLRTGFSADLLDKSAYAIAQYNASFHNDERLNEVWMNVTGLTKGGCQSFEGIH